MKSLQSVLSPILASLLAIIIGVIIVSVMGYNPLTVYASMLSGAFGNVSSIANTLTSSIPLVLCGLGISIAFQCGLFNIGADGQYWVAACTTVWVGCHFTGLPGWLHIILCIVVGMLTGVLWGGVIPGLTKAFVGSHEVITTMMMSYIGILLAGYLIEGGPMQQPGYTPQSPQIAANTQLPYFAQVLAQSQLSLVAVAIALVAAFAAWFLLYKTTIGYQLRAVGFNQRASRYAGIRVKWYTILALALSGMFAGLAGSVQMLGVDHRLLDGFTSNYGYTAIVVALLARNNPFGILLSALFFGALNTGGQNMQIVSGIPASLTQILTGLIIFFVACERVLPMFIRWLQKKRHSGIPLSAGGEQSELGNLQ